ncbi:ATP synthase F1 subunit epsilon [Patescibacteria group bacterium]|nr:ATP synthase F1 subunit epsilon [Patescibacteria group bacterium]MBU0879621.1 ATP synthase F1 subunit epsilon [Patescibacteria group bacterium]MBU0880379.1 ATP synthase F1 subunit epsilon [Patescibacteria group bacterium]MBU0897606.1 ATP synthase F1 subunit epsilon [Patescibacteria group bacterium]MBU1783346.1 ATP synthase F1 subunit epsilon [Patescibacteria group bacterium]
MSDKFINFEIVTPERVVLKEEILQITLPTKAGEITVLPNHIPLVSSLMPGVIYIKKKNGESEIMSISGGFLEVSKNKVVILADTAERAEELDMIKVEEAHRRAEEIKKNIRHTDQIDFAEINANIAKELARTHAIKRWRKLKNLDDKSNI